MITRLNNFYILEKQADFLNVNLKELVIDFIATFEKNKLHISCNNGKRSLMLEYNMENNFTYIILRDGFTLPSKNIAYVMDECNGKKISMVSLVNDDRLISIFFEDNSYLLFNFVNHKQNCFYIKESIILNSFKNNRELRGVNLKEILNNQDSITKEQKELGKFGKEALALVPDLQILMQKYTAPEYLLYKSGENIFASFFEISNVDINVKKIEYSNINELLFNWIKYRNREKNYYEARQEILSSLSKKLKQTERSILSLQTQLKNVNESVKYKIYGEKIIENIWKIKKGDAMFEIMEEDLKIKLKETLSPQENAQSYFEKYKKQKGSDELLKKKLSEVDASKKKIEEEIESIKNNKDYKILKKMAVKEERVREDETNKFRKFKVSDDLEVWVGKDSATNDLLTMKYSAQNDLWFHVRGFSGSHTVLKTGSKKEIDKKFILSAASIAAYYSKARNGGNVPVAYTERKYVKKKKGFREGSVILEKEKVIFVKPGLPEQET